MTQSLPWHDHCGAPGTCLSDLDPFDQAVIHVTKLDAGGAFNVIPDKATIGGTLRTMRADTRQEMQTKIETVAKTTAELPDVKSVWSSRVPDDEP